MGTRRQNPPLTRVEDMAHYLKEIRVVQPEGPYLIGGDVLRWSGGLKWRNNFSRKVKRSVYWLLDVGAWGFYDTLPKEVLSIGYFIMAAPSWFHPVIWWPCRCAGN